MLKFPRAGLRMPRDPCNAFARFLVERVREARGSVISFIPSDAAGDGVSAQAMAFFLERLAERGVLSKWGRKVYMLSRGSALWELAKLGDAGRICDAVAKLLAGD